MNNPPTIFVSIAAYRDFEVIPTVESLLQRSVNPESIHICVFWQYHPDEGPLDFGRYNSQVTVINIDYRRARGLCWARHQIQQYYGNEDYFLQIDSHSRFIDAWDAEMIDQLSRCPSEKAVLSTYPNHYTLPNTLIGEDVCYKLVYYKHHISIPYFHSRFLTEEEQQEPTISLLVSGGFQFARGRVVHEVPYDPYLYFLGDEISMTVRYWTSGYDLYTPTKALMFHLYAVNAENKKFHWNDHKDWHTKFESLSRSRLLHLLGMETSTDPEVLRDFDRYGLGKVRTLEQYQKFADVDFKGETFGPRATEGIPGPY